MADGKKRVIGKYVYSMGAHQSVGWNVVVLDKLEITFTGEQTHIESILFN